MIYSTLRQMYDFYSDGMSATDIANSYINDLANKSTRDVLEDTISMVQIVANMGDSLGKGNELTNNASSSLSTLSLANDAAKIYQSITQKNEINLHDLNNLLGNLFVAAGDGLASRGFKAGEIFSVAGIFIKEYGDHTYNDGNSIMAADDFFNADNFKGFLWEKAEDWSKFVYSAFPDWMNPWLDLDRSKEQKYYFTDPLIIDLDGNGIKTLAAAVNRAVMFDDNANGIRNAIGWVDANDGILVRDINQDGKINNGREIFGDAYELKSGALAKNGYEALAEFDSNQDGKVDANDADFAELRIWRDVNSNGITDDGELLTLEAAGVKALNLEHTAVDEKLEGDNTITQKGSYEKLDGSTAEMGDVNFTRNTLVSEYVEKIPLTSEQLLWMNLKGVGNLRDLREAAATFEPLAETKRESLLDALIYRWTGSEDVDPYSRDPKKIYPHVMDARQLVTLEHLTGHGYLGTWCFDLIMRHRFSSSELCGNGVKFNANLLQPQE